MKASRSMMVLAVCAMVLLSASATLARPKFTFTVTNNTKHKIVGLVASESGEEAGEFDVGAGIGPGKSMEFEWNKSTDNSHCEWAFSAVFDDGNYSEPVMINFCEDDLELVFDP